MEWSNEEVLQFIGLYKNKPILWDTKNANHYNKQYRTDAWDEISMDIGYPAEECKRKMQSLQSSFRREKSKITHSYEENEEGSDEIYRPSWFAFASLSFLLDKKQPATAALINSSNNSIHNTIVKEELDVDCDDEVSIKCTNKRPRLDDPLSVPHTSTITTATVPTLKNGYKFPIGEFEAVGINVANKLKKMRTDQQIYAEGLLTKVLLKGLLGELSLNTDITNSC